MSTTPKTLTLPINITPRALQKLAEYNELLNLDNEAFIRLGVKKEGAHQKKILGIDEKRFTDQKYEHENLSFVIDRRELKHLEGHKLDFKETSNQKGFVFRPLKNEKGNA
jgi:Fe-S cluster assembly iron-binding protein IscA